MYLTTLKYLILKIFSFLTLALLLLIVSCKKEDNEVEPPRDIQEQSVVDDKSLEDFLSTHFYNYDDFLDTENINELICKLNDSQFKTYKKA